jgi:hypothetical protein
MKHDFAFFNVDCMEKNISSSVEFDYSLRPRVSCLKEKLERIDRLVREHDASLVFTTCCSGKSFAGGDFRDVFFVPVRTRIEITEEMADNYRIFFMERKICGTPLENHISGAFNTFDHNVNGISLISAIGAKNWIVFGNCLDACVDHVVRTLLSLNLTVYFLTDVLVSGATGYGNSGTIANREKVLNEWNESGAVGIALDDLQSMLSGF